MPSAWSLANPVGLPLNMREKRVLGEIKVSKIDMFRPWIASGSQTSSVVPDPHRVQTPAAVVAGERAGAGSSSLMVGKSRRPSCVGSAPTPPHVSFSFAHARAGLQISPNASVVSRRGF